MCHVFFIHSLVKGHLDCFQVLSMTNNAAINIVEHMYLWHNWTSFGYIPKSSSAGFWGRLFPNFLKITILISKVVIQVYIPTSNWGVFPLLHILSSISDISVLDLGHSYRYKMKSQSCFDFYNVKETCFSYLSYQVWILL